MARGTKFSLCLYIPFSILPDLPVLCWSFFSYCCRKMDLYIIRISKVIITRLVSLVENMYVLRLVNMCCML